MKKLERKPFYPTESQELLLKAALLKTDHSLKAWARWKNGVDINKIDPGTMRILPLLYKNLHHLQINDPILNKSRGVYRLTWYKNQILINRLLKLLSAIKEKQIDLILLKGTALILFYYEDFGLRPMSDIDLYVPMSQITSMVRYLTDSKWSPSKNGPQITPNLNPCFFNIWYAQGFKEEQGSELDLHWKISLECCYWDISKNFSDFSQVKTFKNETFRILNPTDQLFHVCLHGAAWDIIPGIRWIADAITILKRSEHDIDWDRFIENTERLRVSLPIKDALKYLMANFDTPIPSTVLSRIETFSVFRQEVIYYNLRINKPPKLLGYLPFLWIHFQRLNNNLSFFRKYISFPLFLKNIWGLEHLLEIPYHALKMAFIRLRRLIRKEEILEQ